MAGLQENEFYFLDCKGNRVSMFSLEEFPEDSKELPLDILMVSEGQSRREVFQNRLVSNLRSLGESGDYIMGQALVLLLLAKYLKNAENYGDILLLGEDVSSVFAKSLSKIMESFSMDSRLYCIKEGTNETVVIGSSLVSLPQSIDNICLPNSTFSVVIVSDNRGSLPLETLKKAMAAVGAGGIIFCLSSQVGLRDYFLKNCSRAEYYLITEELTICCQMVSGEYVRERYKSAYPGLALNRFVPFANAVKKKNVLFMPCGMSQWEKMKPLYMQLMSEKDKCTALIMPIPYGEKDEKGDIIEWHYEGNNFSPYYEVLDFKAMNLAALSPDVIVADSPHDSYDVSSTVDEKYYTERMCHEAGRIICLSEVDDINECLRGGDVLEGFPEWRPVILYGGATWQAEKFYYQYVKRDSITFFANRQAGGKFHEREIVSLKDISDLSKYTIVVATPWWEYEKIKNEFIRQGLREFHGFYYWEAYIKKIAVIHANCNGLAYREFLRKSQEFSSKYFIYPLPAIHENHEKNIDESLLKECELFIHQEIRKDNEFSYYFSDEYILPRLKKSCKKIIIPKLGNYADIIFPVSYVTDTPKLKLGGAANDMLFQGNRIIDEAFQKRKNIDGIIAEFVDVDIASQEDEEKCKKNFHDKIEMLKEREKTWDVKISDYIIENYRDYKLFTDTVHPSRMLIMEICHRIADVLMLKNTENIFIEEDYEMVESFVMPWVKKVLGLRFKEEYVRTNSRINWEGNARLKDGKMDLREYIREYVYWKYGEFLD